MKNKLFSLILTLCMIIPVALAIAGCGGDPPDNPHTHSWSTTYSQDTAYHWLTCDGCNDTKDKEPHDGDTCSVCGYVKGEDLEQSVPTVVSVSDLEIITYDTGTEGVVTLIKLPDGKHMMIDAGTEDTDSKTLIRRNIKSTQNISTIDYFVLTNTTAIRTGQAEYVMNSFDVKNFYTPRVINLYSPLCYQAALAATLATCNAQEVGESNCDITCSFKDGQNNTYTYTIDFMIPVETADCKDDTDHANIQFNSSIAISIEYAGKTVLISGDATEKTIDKYCTKYNGQKDADILITSFYLVEPYAIVNSKSRGNDYLECISLDANDYAIVTPISSGTNVGSLTEMLVDYCQNNLNVFLLADESGYLTSTVKITSAGVVSVTAE